MPFHEPTKQQLDGLTTTTGLLLAEIARTLAASGENEKLEKLRQQHLDAFEKVTSIGMVNFR